LGVTCWNIAEIFGIGKLESLGYCIVWHCLHDPKFSHLSRTPTCDRQADGHTMTAYNALA